jgi:hypothetical protein
MASLVLHIDRSKGVSRTAWWNALFVTLSGLHAVALIAWPTIPVIALGVWWNSNTVAHNFIHRPFFRSRLANLAFFSYQSALLGIPQALWRDRHLAHHAKLRWRLRVSPQLAFETMVVLSLWMTLAFVAPHFFMMVYLPGYCAGLALCGLQGYYEHQPGTTSHYGRIYNFLCFNDGYHAEHHARPWMHWTALPTRVEPGIRTSQWPALLRWIENLNLESLERRVLVSPVLQRYVRRSHRKAIRALLPQLPLVRRVTVVGGGLFPRTALIVRELIPEAQIEIVDASLANIGVARPFFSKEVTFRNRRYQPGEPCCSDLVVIPLSFEGDREAIYRHPPEQAMLVHDWIWRRRGVSRIVSLALLKRVNLILP